MVVLRSCAEQCYLKNTRGLISMSALIFEGKYPLRYPPSPTLHKPGKPPVPGPSRTPPRRRGLQRKHILL